MREKVLDTIKNAEKALNPTDIMNIIKPDNTVKDYEELLECLRLLCQDGIIRLTSGNGYVMNELLVGKMDMHVKGNGHVLVRDGEDVFINKTNMNGALDKDIVLVDYINSEHTEGKVVRILKRSLGRGVAEVVNNNGHFTIKPLDNLPYHVEIEKPEIELVDGLLVHLDYVKDIAKGRVLAKIDYTIGHKNAIHEHTPEGKRTMLSLIGSEFGRVFEFPQEVLDEVKEKGVKSTTTKDEIDEAIKKGMRDLRGETITTIDGKDTKDIDDAINVTILPNGNFLVTVAIAYVSHYVERGSKVWQFAEIKGCSDYCGNKVGPMLPIEYSNGVCSLWANEDRLAVVTEFELTHSGEILHPEVFEAVIRSKQKMNYDAVQDIIDGKYTDDTEGYTFLKYTIKEDETTADIAYKYGMTEKELFDCNKDDKFKDGEEINIPTRRVVLNNYIASRIMKSELKSRGKIDFPSREGKHVFDENDNPIDKHKRVQRPAEELIENFMIRANEAFAEFMTRELSEIFGKPVPFVYRTHGEPNPKKVQEFLDMLNVLGVELPIKINPEKVTCHDVQIVLDSIKDRPDYEVLADKALRMMQKARYTDYNFGHFGIASTLYCHSTSPIRRMPDLVVQTMYKELIVEKRRDPETLKFWEEYLGLNCEKMSECEVDAEQCEYAWEEYLDATMMEDKVGQTFEATINGLMSDGFFVITDKLIEGKVEYFLEKIDADEILTLDDQNEIAAFVNEYQKLFTDKYDYNEKMFGYSRNNRVCLRYGDRILVVCTGAYPERREVDFTMVRKI